MTRTDTASLIAMARFPSLPTPTGLEDVFKEYPAGLFPLLELHDVILREDSPLTVAERELIAAFVSGINGCQFCYGSHRAIAEAYR
jgi:AhpD family alkylhydroperoxidase